MDKFSEKTPILTFIHIEQMKYEAKFATNLFKIAVLPTYLGILLAFWGKWGVIHNLSTITCFCSNFNVEGFIMIVATPQILDDMDYYLPDEKSSQGLANFFALLADPSRVKMLSALTISPLCVTDLAQIVKMNQTTVSHQLRLLKDRGVVDCTRVGKIIKYHISNKKINEILLVGVEYLGMGQ